MNATAQISAGERIQRQLTVAMGRLPAGLLKLMVKVPTNAAGEQMAPEIAMLMAAIAKAADFSDLSPTEARAAEMKDVAVYGERPIPMDRVDELDLGDGLSATRYRAGRESRGLIVFFHGGGFVLSNRAAYDGPVRLLAQATHMDVLSVEYRLAPEHPFPASHQDAARAWEYAVDQAGRWGIPQDRIVVMGDSAGANIAAVLALALRGADVQPALQVLAYPATDLAGQRDSNEEFASSPALTAKQIAWFLDHYLPPAVDRTSPQVSPIFAVDLAGLPPAIVTVAGFDPLRDDGLDYAARLTASGVHTEVIRESGLVHGYLGLTALSPTSRKALLRLASAIVIAMN